MKKLFLILASTSLSLISCSSDHRAPEMLNNEIQKKEIFTAIISDDKLLSEFMDTMMNHHDKMMAMMGSKMKTDKKMQMDMMSGMMDMCEKDTGMCKQMMQMMKDKPNMKMQMKNMDAAPPVKDTVDHKKHH